MFDELPAAEANRRFYAEFAGVYNESEECVVDARLQRRLRRVLEMALARLADRPRVLDACGGSGNASLILLDLGVRPTTVDVSEEMLSLYAEAAQARGYDPCTQVAEIDAFLAEDGREWDLVVFSSALHHLENYEGTVERAAGSLAHGGMLLTIFDPTRGRKFERRVRRLDYIGHVIIRTPRRVPRLVARRLSPLARRSVDEQIALANRAELHALDGIDDVALRKLFERLGLDVVVQERTYEARFGVTRAIYRAAGRPSSFHFLVRRPQVAPRA